MKAIKAVCFRTSGWERCTAGERTSGVLRLHPTSVYFRAPARKLFPTSEPLTPRQLANQTRPAVYILSARTSVGHVYVAASPRHPAAAKTTPENSAANTDSSVLCSVSCEMAAEGPKEEVEAAPAAETVATAKAVAEEEVVAPAPGPPAGDSKALVVVDSESYKYSVLSPCPELLCCC